MFTFSGLAKQLMDGLEVLSDKKNCYFVDLFVRVSNKATHQSTINEYLFNKTAKFREKNLLPFLKNLTV
jgi:hypothetical protein